ncbi:tRNA lysidine(34) synthetase TilS [Paenibacillus paeoniae]|uniref:tRNA(Ile)-lysidine synthase n=1 Tax=Paenibacillus paeoniae TaxID=2292705 RepID=A0A371P002_9BACL|nr:tRNA lysidine(34) synthetase TilS [Paenibacillus paeoniae]REK69243.1 tRNA lysidine(34) synthetase TilS [Paenibacillus paeoniae]
MNEPLQTVLAKEAAAHNMWEKDDTILVAVSGGPDSMALLHMLHGLSQEQGIKLVAAHVNHGFRVQESAYEMETVQSFADSLGVPCESVVLDMPTYIEENRLNLQAAAREKRYEYLHRIAVQYGASRIALAHHADDQAETVLMRLIRGAGLSGLSGMSSVRREKNMQLIRPLLRMNKSDLLRYCEEHEIPYCVDSSNLARYYFRNTVRLDVIPYLMQFNPQLPQSLQRLAEVAGAEDEWMEQQAAEWFDRIVRCSEGECQVECRELSGLHVALQRRLIKLILNYLSRDSENITYGAVETMRLAASTHAPATWRMDVAGGIRCLREYGVMRWVHMIAESPTASHYNYVIEEQSEGRIEASPSGWSFRLDWLAAAAAKPSSRMEAYFDVDGLIFPLHVRNRMPGDRIHVLGLNGSKKVQDMFVDEKVPPSRRELYPLLCDGEGKLLWIPGIRRSTHALAGSGSARVLRITALNE